MKRPMRNAVTIFDQKGKRTPWPTRSRCHAKADVSTPLNFTAMATPAKSRKVPRSTWSMYCAIAA